MQLTLGGYKFPVNGCEVTGRVGYERSDSGRPLRYTQYLDVNGTLFGSGQADMTRLEDELRDALRRPYRDLVLKRDDGGNSALRLINAESLSGVVATSGPDFFEAQGSEYVTTRRFRFTAEATYLMPGTQTALVSWTQTVSVVGNGGPVRSWRVPVNADPIRQTLTKASVIRYTQSGAAVGNFAPPIPPPPVFGRAYLVNEQEAVTRTVGRPLGKYWIEPSVQWNYVFETSKPLVGVTPLPVF